MELANVFIGNEPQAAIIRAFLERHGIKSVVEGTNTPTIVPRIDSPAGEWYVCVRVTDDDAERARTLIAQKDRGE